MVDNIELSPELLMQQSQQMMNIQSAFESLFGGVLSDLQGINSSWSDMLSNNFTAKISSAQKSFMGSLGMMKISAGSVKSVAEALMSTDSEWAKKVSGVDLPNVTKALYEKMSSDFKDNKEYFEEHLSSSELAWIKKLTEMAEKKVFGESGGLGIVEKLLEGDYRGATQKTGKILGKAVLDAIGLKDYADYAYNLVEDSSEAITKFALDPSFESLLKIGWNVTAQPILDTSGGDIEDFIKLVPGVSEYYKAHGGTGIGNICQTALGDFYGIVTGDDELKDYVSSYYSRTDDAFDGIARGFNDMASFVKDSGGIVNAFSNFVSTASKDMQEYSKSTPLNMFVERGPYFRIDQGFVSLFDEYFLGKEP